MVRTVPSEVIDAALQIIDMAKAELDCELNPNVVLTLADHLQFAVERLKDGCVIENPLSDRLSSSIRSSMVWAFAPSLSLRRRPGFPCRGPRLATSPCT